MAQPATKVDVLQVEPGASGTRTVSRDATTGGLKFVDPAYPSGILLADLAGLQSLSSVAVVGTTFSTIQDAIDAAPTGGDTPPVVLVPGGAYVEDVTISKDVILVGLGYVSITNATATDTVTIVEDADGVPRHVEVHNVTVVCTEDGASCVLVDGSHTFASGTVTVEAAPLAAGDTVTINGNVLTGVAGARTPGSDDFCTTGGTPTIVAAEIAAAINDASNSFAADVSATASLGVVTVEAAAPGSGGNAITLAAATTPDGNLVVSGATLEGGGGLDSEVGLTEVAFVGCTLVASGVGTRQVTTQTVNNVRFSGGSWFGSSSTSESFVAQTASFKMYGVEWANDVQAAYDSDEDQPAVTTSEFSVVGCGRLNTLITNYVGAGSVRLANIPVVGDVTVNGDRTFTAVNCEMGATLIEDTVAARLVNCTRDSLGGVGTPTVAESSVLFQSTLEAAGADSVTFPQMQPDTAYAVLVDVPVLGVTANVTSRSTLGFTVDFSAPVTGTVSYAVFRQM
jgi:hypothetical protein